MTRVPTFCTASVVTGGRIYVRHAGDTTQQTEGTNVSEKMATYGVVHIRSAERTSQPVQRVDDRLSVGARRHPTSSSRRLAMRPSCVVPAVVVVDGIDVNFPPASASCRLGNDRNSYSQQKQHRKTRARIHRCKFSLFRHMERRRPQSAYSNLSPGEASTW